MNHTEFIPAKEIITDVVQTLGDEEYREKSFPYYMQLVQRAVTELAFDTAFDSRIFEANIPANLRIELPAGLANIEKLLLYNGEKCSPEHSVECHWHRHFLNKTDGGYLAANNYHNEDDHIIPRMGASDTAPSDLYYWNIQNGVLMLSSNCNVWERVHVRYAGMGYVKFGDEPHVPMFAREAIIAFVLHKAATAMKIRDPQRYSAIAAEAKADIDRYGGPWSDAIKRMAALDRAQRKDMEAYYDRFGRTY